MSGKRGRANQLDQPTSLWQVLIHSLQVGVGRAVAYASASVRGRNDEQCSEEERQAGVERQDRKVCAITPEGLLPCPLVLRRRCSRSSLVCVRPLPRVWIVSHGRAIMLDPRACLKHRAPEVIRELIIKTSCLRYIWSVSTIRYSPPCCVRRQQALLCASCLRAT